MEVGKPAAEVPVIVTVHPLLIVWDGYRVEEGFWEGFKTFPLCLFVCLFCLEVALSSQWGVVSGDCQVVTKVVKTGCYQGSTGVGCGGILDFSSGMLITVVSEKVTDETKWSNFSKWCGHGQQSSLLFLQTDGEENMAIVHVTLDHRVDLEASLVWVSEEKGKWRRGSSPMASKPDNMGLACPHSLLWGWDPKAIWEINAKSSQVLLAGG